MSFLLDTNICSYYLRQQGGLQSRFVQYGGQLRVSTLVVGELYAWAKMRSDPVPIMETVEHFLEDEFEIIDFDVMSAVKFGELRGDLKRQGIGVPVMDLLIAAVALAHDYTLGTHNITERCATKLIQKLQVSVGCHDFVLEKLGVDGDCRRSRLLVN